MSISAFQDKIFKSGCGVVVLLVSAAAMGAGLFYTSCGNNVRDLEGSKAGPAAIMVGDVPIPPSQLDAGVQQMLSQSPMGSQSVEPRLQAMFLMQVMNQTVQGAAMIVAAQHEGVDLSDKSILAYLNLAVDRFIKESRAQMEVEGKLKPGATDAQFAEEFKKLPQSQGKAPDDFRKFVVADVTGNLADPAKRQSILNNAAPQMLMEKLKAKHNVTDAEVKSNFDSVVVKKIEFPTMGKSAPEVEAQAKKALEEIKSGKLTFEQAVDRYTGAAAPAGKKASDQTQDLSRSMINGDPSMKALATLKPGEVSDVISGPMGQTIYKVISVKNNAPKDFDKNVAKYRDQYLQTIVGPEMQKLADEVEKSGVMKFPLPGYEALYNLGKAGGNPMMGSANKVDAAKLRQIADMAKAATKDDKPDDDRAATLAWFNAIDLLNGQTTDKASLYKERAEVLQAVLQQTETFATRMELVDLGIQMKDATVASTNLIAAAQNNTGTDVMAENNFRDINSKKSALEKDKLITPDQVKQIDDLQSAWRKSKIEADKIKAETDKAERERAAQAKANAPKGSAPTEGSTVPITPVPTPGATPKKPSGP